MESIEAVHSSQEVWMEREEEKAEDRMELPISWRSSEEEYLPAIMHRFKTQWDWCFITWSVTLIVAGMTAFGLILGKAFFEDSQALSLDFERAWWSIFTLFFSLPFVLGLYGLHILQPKDIKVVLYSIDPVVAQGWETPRKITELERKRMFWPNGEFTALPLTEIKLALPFGVMKRWSKTSAVYKFKLSLSKWKALRDRITFQLRSMSREAFLSGVAVKHSFLWVVLASKNGSEPVVALMREPLLDAINHLDMDWEKLLDEHRHFAGCKSSVRRDDGEWIGPCEGSNCRNREHKETEAVYQMFRNFRDLNVHSGRIDTPEAQYTTSATDRILLGFVDLHIPAALHAKKGQQKPVWKLHKWEHI